MLPSVCFETGRFTTTQSSRTACDDCSRKRISGPAPALAQARDQRRFTEAFPPKLREFPGTGKRPFSLDLYLSWMSPGFMKPGFRLVFLLSINEARPTMAASPLSFEQDALDGGVGGWRISWERRFYLSAKLPSRT